MAKSSTQITERDFSTTPTVLNTAEWSREGANTPVYTVVSAVAEVTDSDPGDLPPLYGAVDPEALNDLFTSRANPTVDQVTFRYAGYSIVVRGSGEVQVRLAQDS